MWYNNRYQGGTRNEVRITNFGGGQSALLDPESTGTIAVFIFCLDETGECEECRVWVCRHETEEDLLEQRVGAIEPGKWKFWSIDEHDSLFCESRAARSCWLEPDEIPADWMSRFPSGEEIISKIMELRPRHGFGVDKLLLVRKECEFELFRSVEAAIYSPVVKREFNNIDDFLSKAQSILQSRKSRSGHSLELHTRAIFIEEHLQQDSDFAWQPESESGKNPDFLFPSVSAYKNSTFSNDRLRMLAVKTTCKDRWRQILNEADRISTKHLLTLQEGISERQHPKMVNANVKLIVPSMLHDKYPSSVRPYLQTLESFIGDVRLLNI